MNSNDITNSIKKKEVAENIIFIFLFIGYIRILPDNLFYIYNLDTNKLQLTSKNKENNINALYKDIINNYRDIFEKYNIWTNMIQKNFLSPLRQIDQTVQ